MRASASRGRASEAEARPTPLESLCAQFCAIAGAVPAVIATAFSPASVSPAGCYSLRLFLKGYTYYMLLDDRVPCDPSGSPLNLHSTNTQCIK